MINHLGDIFNPQNGLLAQRQLTMRGHFEPTLFSTQYAVVHTCRQFAVRYASKSARLCCICTARTCVCRKCVAVGSQRGKYRHILGFLLCLCVNATISTR